MSSYLKWERFIIGFTNLIKKKGAPVPDATDIVGIRLIVVIRVAITEVHVPRIRTRVLGQTPVVRSGGLGICCRLSAS